MLPICCAGIGHVAMKRSSLSSYLSASKSTVHTLPQQLQWAHSEQAGGMKGTGCKRLKEKQPRWEVRKAPFWGGLFCLELVKHNYKDVAGVLPLKFDCWINRPQNATLRQTKGAWPLTLGIKVQRDVPLHTTLSSPRPDFTPFAPPHSSNKEQEKEKRLKFMSFILASHLSLSHTHKTGRASRVLGVKNSIS